MEQVQETPIPQSPQIPAESTVAPKFRKSFLITISLLILLIIVTGAVYAGMKIQEKKTSTPSAKITPTQNIPTAVLTEDPTVGWKTYSNKNLYFSFKYPENFMISSDKIKVNSDLSDVFNGLTLIKLINKDIGQPPQITLFIYDTQKTVQEYVQTDYGKQLANWETEKQRLGNDLTKPTMSSLADVPENMIGVKKIEGVTTETAPNSKYVWYLFKKNNLLYKFAVNYGTYNPDTKEDGSNEKAVLDQILSTFKFIE